MQSAQARWIVAAVAAGFSCANIHAATITPVAVRGKPADGVSGFNFANITNIHLNDAGLVSIIGGANPTSGGSGAFGGIWGGTPGSLQLHVRDGVQAPGLPAGWIMEQIMPNLDQNIASDGRIAFGASPRDPGTGSQFASMFVGPIGSPQLVARVGGPAYGVPNATYTNSAQMLFFSSPESGRVVFGNTMTGPGIDATNGGGLWEGPTNSPSLLFRGGQQAPGLPDGILWGSFGGARSSPNGSISFEAFVTGPGVTTQTSYVRYAGSSSNPKPIFRIGMPAPGVGPGVVFAQNGFNFIHPNNAGSEFLLASISGPGITQNNDDIFWFGNGDSLPLVAREGSQAPGLPAGAIFTTVADDTTGDTTPFGKPAFNNHSDVAFFGHFSNGATDGNGLWAGAIGNLKLILKTGDQLPGFANNVHFAAGENAYPQISMNDNGMLAFLAVTDTGKLALFAADAAGNLGYIVGAGDSIPVGGGQFRTVSDLSLSELNSLNQVAFMADFTDNTNGAFIASVPEPSMVLAFISAALLARGSRRT